MTMARVGEDVAVSAARVLQRCGILGDCTEEPGRITRRYGTAALRDAIRLVTEWMQESGMTVARDGVGNLIGRYGARDPDAPTLILGSHLDTVPNGGRYDGPLGVLVALACVERWAAGGERPPVNLEVVAFADEEGTRFGTAFLGSTAYVAGLDSDILGGADADGTVLGDAVRQFGGDPAAALRATRSFEDVLGFVEVHIEQGTVLEERDLPVGVVTAIAGQTRVEAEFRGLAGHAGTTPMDNRHDALVAAAGLVLGADALARRLDGLVATVGEITVQPGAANVVPDYARLTVDVRHSDDRIRRAATAELRERTVAAGARRGVEVSWSERYDTPGVACARGLCDGLRSALSKAGYVVTEFTSGAGHDAVRLADVTDVAMLFVRCAGGVSHHPDEAVRHDDTATAIEVLDYFITGCGRNRGGDQ